MNTENYIVVKNNGRDMSDIIQDIIDSNPKRTIFFPDGVYNLSKPVCTSANPDNSVSLKLSQYAVLKADDNWSDKEAIVRIGGKEPFNDNRSNGSNYGIEGGVVDGNNKASAICIESGRESFIRNISIKRAVKGIHIKPGANSNSSDADIMNVTITGNKSHDSVGILAEGSDNTITNVRICDVFCGIHLVGSANFLRNIHPLFTLDFADFDGSVAFLDDCQNWYTNCYNDNFSVGYCTRSNYTCFYDSCFNFWYSNRGAKHVAFRAEVGFFSLLTNFAIRFRFAEVENIVLENCKSFGQGKFVNLSLDSEFCSDDCYKKYCTGEILHI